MWQISIANVWRCLLQGTNVTVSDVRKFESALATSPHFCKRVMMTLLEIRNLKVLDYLCSTCWKEELLAMKEQAEDHFHFFMFYMCVVIVFFHSCRHSPQQVLEVLEWIDINIYPADYHRLLPVGRKLHKRQRRFLMIMKYMALQEKSLQVVQMVDKWIPVELRQKKMSTMGISLLCDEEECKLPTFALFNPNLLLDYEKLIGKEDYDFADLEEVLDGYAMVVAEDFMFGDNDLSSAEEITSLFQQSLQKGSNEILLGRKLTMWGCRPTRELGEIWKHEFPRGVCPDHLAHYYAHIHEPMRNTFLWGHIDSVFQSEEECFELMVENGWDKNLNGLGTVQLDKWWKECYWADADTMWRYFKKRLEVCYLRSEDVVAAVWGLCKKAGEDGGLWIKVFECFLQYYEFRIETSGVVVQKWRRVIRRKKFGCECMQILDRAQTLTNVYFLR